MTRATAKPHACANQRASSGTAGLRWKLQELWTKTPTSKRASSAKLMTFSAVKTFPNSLRTDLSGNSSTALATKMFQTFPAAEIGVQSGHCGLSDGLPV